MSCVLLSLENDDWYLTNEWKSVKLIVLPLIAAMHCARHYVNNVVQYTTGVHNASAQLIRQKFGTQERNSPHFSLILVRLLQCVTDASNWSRVRATGNAVLASIVYLAGSGAATRVRAVVAGPSYAPGLQHPVRRVVVAALASTAASCPRVPMVQKVADFSAMVGDRANKMKTGVVYGEVCARFEVFEIHDGCVHGLFEVQTVPQIIK